MSCRPDTVADYAAKLNATFTAGYGDARIPAPTVMLDSVIVTQPDILIGQPPHSVRTLPISENLAGAWPHASSARHHSSPKPDTETLKNGQRRGNRTARGRR